MCYIIKHTENAAAIYEYFDVLKDWILNFEEQAEAWMNKRVKRKLLLVRDDAPAKMWIQFAQWGFGAAGAVLMSLFVILVRMTAWMSVKKLVPRHHKFRLRIKMNKITPVQ